MENKSMPMQLLKANSIACFVSKEELDGEYHGYFDSFKHRINSFRDMSLGDVFEGLFRENKRISPEDETIFEARELALKEHKKKQEEEKEARKKINPGERVGKKKKERSEKNLEKKLVQKQKKLENKSLKGTPNKVSQSYTTTQTPPRLGSPAPENFPDFSSLTR